MTGAADPVVDELPSADLLAPQRPPAGRSVWAGLHGCARAMAVARLAIAAEQPVLLIAATPAHVNRYVEELPFFCPDIPIHVLPDWETLPYDQFSPYQDIISMRLRTLSELAEGRPGIYIAATSTALHRLAPRDWVTAQHFSLRSGQQLDRDGFLERLDKSGYRRVSEVLEHGDYAVRGSLFDVFPMGSDVPVRIDLLDDDIDTLRSFSVETQRSGEVLESIEILPAREFSLGQASITAFRQQWRTRFEGRPTNAPLYNDVSEGLAPAGIEYYLPLFFERTDSVFDYLPGSASLVVDAEFGDAAAYFADEVTERYEQLQHDPQRPLLPPADLFFDRSVIDDAVARWHSVELSGTETEDRQALGFGTRPAGQVPVDSRAAEPFGAVRRFVDGFDGRVLFVAESAGRRETISELFRRHGLPFTQVDDWAGFVAGDMRVGLAVAPLDEGVILRQPPIAIIAESQLFGRRASQQRRRRRSATDPDAVIRNLTELHLDAPVVHEAHGVGRYQGLEQLEAGGIVSEYIKLEYADGDKLYVPVASLHMLSRYSGVDPEHAPLHKLGSGQWDKARRKAAERVRDVAAELLDIYARREAQRGHAFSPDADAFSVFSQQFPFEETPDQAAAIEAVLEDMQRERPMDRLVCGDVGFGKTEVAMRAAFIAADAGKQVAILVPTTLLAQQHYQTFVDRFADWPFRIEQLSRFRTGPDMDRVLAGLRDGSVDIVIGTHKLLSREVAFKQLGLVVIDEEHRFGVRQKEKFKALRSTCDILTLTATPIPRTLNLALSGTRELSVIATAPSKRLAIKTFVREWSDGLIREALLREITRGGQVYFVHNRVEDIEKTAEHIAAIVPEARVSIAHGQMRERDLEQVMLDFYHQRSNVLVCTTIIETGIDVPTANTIVLNRADRFGLAQLYQLRGRVGRSHHRAYAYLVVPPRQSITPDAVKRLEAIESLEDLGVGFTLATHDLEIRGAGEILGDEQSGHIQEIGFGLYTDMLQRAVEAMKSGQDVDLDRPFSQGIEIDLHLPALLPEDFLPDVNARLTLYKRIASAEDQQALRDLREEVIDRFGFLPPPAQNLFRVTALKLSAQALGISRIDVGSRGGRILFGDKPNVDPVEIIKLVQTSTEYRLEGQTTLRISKELHDYESRFNDLEPLLEKLRPADAA